MKTFKIKAINTQKTLFEGHFQSFKQCLETAIQNGFALHYADLSRQDLSNTNLDDSKLKYADFSHSNLSGANLSESELQGANFTNAALLNTCLCYSNLSHSNFSETSFGATDIKGCTINTATFTTLSCFSLNYAQASEIKACSFTDIHGQKLTFSRPPIVINGLSTQPVILIGKHTLIGHTPLKNKRLLSLTKSLMQQDTTAQISI